jgi:hypothetical protein
MGFPSIVIHSSSLVPRRERTYDEILVTEKLNAAVPGRNGRWPRNGRQGSA